jgi:hypothetical protein
VSSESIALAELIRLNQNAKHEKTRNCRCLRSQAYMKQVFETDYVLRNDNVGIELT